MNIDTINIKTTATMTIINAKDTKKVITKCKN